MIVCMYLCLFYVLFFCNVYRCFIFASKSKVDRHRVPVPTCNLILLRSIMIIENEVLFANTHLISK